MPSFTHQIANLASVGPIVEVTIGWSRPFSAVMEVKGAEPPHAVKAIAMIDTGAQVTVLAPSIVTGLKLSPVGLTAIHTPSTTKALPASRYNVSLVFPNDVVIPSVIAFGAALGGQPIQCLIGCDVLRHGVLTYIGYINQFTLSF